MKKHQKLETLLGKNSQDNFFFNIAETTIIKVNLSAGDTTKIPLLSSILMQKGLNAENFYKSFNNESIILWQEKTLLPTIIFITPLKSFFHEIKNPTLFMSLNELYNFKTMKIALLFKRNKKKEICLAFFYTAVIYSLLLKKTYLKQIIKQFIGSYRSWNTLEIPATFKAFKFKKKKK